MEETMLLFFHMPLIIASAMFRPAVERKPVDKED
jgi:hypothetical protein